MAAVAARPVEIAGQPRDLGAPLAVGVPPQEVVRLGQRLVGLADAGQRLDDRHVGLDAQDAVGIGRPVAAPGGHGALAGCPIFSLSTLPIS